MLSCSNTGSTDSELSPATVVGETNVPLARCKTRRRLRNRTSASATDNVQDVIYLTEAFAPLYVLFCIRPARVLVFLTYGVHRLGFWQTQLCRYSARRIPLRPEPPHHPWEKSISRIVGVASRWQVNYSATVTPFFSFFPTHVPVSDWRSVFRVSSFGSPIIQDPYSVSLKCGALALFVAAIFISVRKLYICGKLFHDNSRSHRECTRGSQSCRHRPRVYLSCAADQGTLRLAI